jgi:hypothetical protein
VYIDNTAGSNLSPIEYIPGGFVASQRRATSSISPACLITELPPGLSTLRHNAIISRSISYTHILCHYLWSKQCGKRYWFYHSWMVLLQELLFMSDKAPVKQPVLSCDIEDNIFDNPARRDGCESGGGSFACSDLSPWAASADLAYGFAGVNLVASNESAWCCSCYS